MAVTRESLNLGARKSDSARMAFIEWVDAEHIVEEKSKKEKKAKRKEPEAKPQQTTPEAEQPTREEPKAEAPAAKQEEPTTTPAEEPKTKKRRWFGRKSDEEKLGLRQSCGLICSTVVLRDPERATLSSRGMKHRKIKPRVLRGPRDLVVDRQLACSGSRRLFPA